MEMEWKWNGNGMEMEWKWNGNGMEMEWKRILIAGSEAGAFLLATSNSGAKLVVVAYVGETASAPRNQIGCP